MAVGTVLVGGIGFFATAIGLGIVGWALYAGLIAGGGTSRLAVGILGLPFTLIGGFALYGTFLGADDGDTEGMTEAEQKAHQARMDDAMDDAMDDV